MVIGAMGREIPPRGGGGGTIWPTQQAGKGMEEGKEPNCTYSPAFLESHQRWVPVMVGPLLTLTSPNLSSICLAPAASGKFPWDQESSFPSSGDRCGVWAQRRREGLPCLGPRKEGSCRAWEPPSWAWASIHVPNIAASPVQSLRY